MTQEQELTLADLQREIAQLKNDVKRAVTGPRGPQGPIDACVRQSTIAAEKIVDASLKKTVLPFERMVNDLKTQFERLKADVAQTRENNEHEIAYHLISLLTEYHIIDRDGNPLAGPYAASSIPTKKS